MIRKLVLVMALSLVLLGMLTSTFNIQPVKAPNGITYIYIRAEGDVDPLGSPISSSDNVTYYFTGDMINKTLVVERDNITIDGKDFTLYGPEEENTIGIKLHNRTNVTIKNTSIEKFNYGIEVYNCSKIVLDGNNASYNKILVFIGLEEYWTGIGISVSRSRDIVLSSNNVTNNISGIGISSCNNTLVVRNNVSNNRESEDSTYVGGGISLYDSRCCTLIDNVISGNGATGISITSLGHTYSSFNNTIRNNTIAGAFGTSYGISISESRNNTIAENTILSNTYGIQLYYYSKNHTIINNNVSGNSFGVYLDKSQNNAIINNTISKNAEGIRFENASNNDILYNNVSGNNGQAVNIRSDSRNNVLLGNNVSNNPYGVHFVESRNNYIFWNSILSNNYTGLSIYYYSNNNTVVSNNISSNGYGITVTYASYNNKIFHNNFINNTKHVYTDMNSTWDKGYPSGGNYWSNYTGVDFYSGLLQDETGSDGIGDTSHMINANNTDNYPLMAPINTFDAGIWNETTCYIDIVSNSTISNFQLNIADKTISFNVTGEEGIGFCRITIPDAIIQDLWQGNYTVLVNGQPVDFRNWTDDTNTYIYFTYQHSTQNVEIVPEFPTWTPLLILIALTIFIVFYKRRPLKTQPTK